MKSFYVVKLDSTGGMYRDAQFTYGTLTELQQALDFEFWKDLRYEVNFLLAYDDLPFRTYTAGRMTGEINLLPFITIRGANGVEFTLHEKGARHNITRTKEEGAVLSGTNVRMDDEFLSSAVVFVNWGAVPVKPLEEPLLEEGEKAEHEEEYRGQIYQETFEYGYFDAESDSDDCDADFRAEMEEELAIDPDWLSFDGGTIRALAESMHSTGDYSGMPALADALQEAGCENEQFLTHCRAPGGVHARGSWVVELLRRS